MIPTKSEMNLENNKIVRPGLKKKNILYSSTHV